MRGVTMTARHSWEIGMAAAAVLLAIVSSTPPTFAQEQSAAATADSEATATSPEPLSEDELEVLVARIALYPDDLVALISGASLYPLQIVEAARFLDQYEKDKSLKPKESWDGSVVSLLNYPQIVRMMSDDLDWTQKFGDAIAYQQKDVLIAIQQLRDEAVAKGVIKSDDKVEVVTENDNVVIRPANPETVYVPQYEPQMFYEPGYAWEPVTYYPEPYPPYWYPGATFFAGAVTGAIWAAAVDWDDWGVWGGDWDGNDIDIDCNNCFNDRDFNGKINFNDADWKNIDRNKINFDRDKLNNIDRNELKNRIKQDSDNSIRDRARDIKRGDQVASRVPGKGGGSKDVRKSVQEGLKSRPAAEARPANVDRTPKKQSANNRSGSGKAKVDRPVGKPKPARKADQRSKKPSGLGNVDRGKTTRVSSNRGHKSMGGGHRGGGRKVQRGGGGRGGGGRR
jgi:hypothetical protein